MNGPRILIINPFGIGDVLFSTPLVEALKNIYPSSYIGYICNRRALELIRSNPGINKILMYEKDDYRALWQKSKFGCIKEVIKLLIDLRKEKFDIGIDLSLSYQYSFLLKVIGVRKRIGFNYRNRGRFLTDKINIEGFDSKHVIEYYLDVLKLLGADPEKYKGPPRVYLMERDAVWAEKFLKDNGIKENDLVIGVIPGCGASWGMDARYRRWDRKNFAKSCDLLIERFKAKVILFGDPKEVEICNDMVKLMKNDCIIACGKTSLRDFLALLKRCKLVVTNDGGPLHMAVGLGVKTISIFGPVDDKIYGPYPANGNHAVLSKKNLACRPCYKRFKHKVCDDRVCLDGIKPEEVLQAAERLLSHV